MATESQDSAPAPVETPVVAAPETQTPAPSEFETLAGPGNGVQDIADLLGLSAAPPKPEGEVKPEGETKPQVQAKPEEKPGVQPPVVPGDEAPKDEVKPPEGEKDLKTLLKEVIAEAQPQEKKPEEKPAEPEKPFYQPKVPPELMAALEHEDPAVRQQGMSALIGGAMNKVRADVMATVQTLVQQAVASVPQTIETRQQAQAQAQEGRRVFYEANPAFAKSPKTQQLVAMMGMQLAQSMGKDYQGFTPEFQAKLAQTFSEATGIPAGKAAAPTGEVKGAKPPPRMTGQVPTRSADPIQSLSDEILDLVGGGAPN